MDEDRVQLRWCADCEGRTLFEVPPCEDGHGIDCLDMACVECGAAVVAGVMAPHEQLLRETSAA